MAVRVSGVNVVDAFVQSAADKLDSFRTRQPLDGDTAKSNPGHFEPCSAKSDFLLVCEALLNFSAIAALFLLLAILLFKGSYCCLIGFGDLGSHLPPLSCRSESVGFDQIQRGLRTVIMTEGRHGKVSKQPPLFKTVEIQIWQSIVPRESLFEADKRRTLLCHSRKIAPKPASFLDAGIEVESGDGQRFQRPHLHDLEELVQGPQPRYESVPRASRHANPESRKPLQRR